MQPARQRRLVALLVAASLLAAGLPGSVPAVRAATSGVTVDLSLGNGIASGAVIDPDPAHALVTARNGYHFWAGLDLQAPTGAAQLAPAALAVDARGIYGTLGLIGPEATSAWAGTFGAGGGSQAVWIHDDLATPRGAQALALTCLTIVADTFGAPLLAPSAAVVQHAVTLITDLAPFSDLLAAVQRNDPWAIAKQWSLLLQSGPGRAAIIEALADLGVIATDAGLKALGSVVGLIDFAQTMVDILRAGLGGHTSGLVTFTAAGVASTGGSTPPTVAIHQWAWSVVAPPPPTWRWAVSTLLSDGRVLLLGYDNICMEGIGGGPRIGGLHAALYDPTADRWRQLPDSMDVADPGGIVSLPGGRALLLGRKFPASSSDTGPLEAPAAEVFDGASMSWQTVQPPAVSDEFVTLVLSDSTLLVVGGSLNGKPVRSIEAFNGSGWRSVAELPMSLTQPVAVALDGGTVLIAGVSSDDPSLGGYVWNPKRVSFTRIGALGSGRRLADLIQLPDHTIVGWVTNVSSVGVAVFDQSRATWSSPRALDVPNGASELQLADGSLLAVGGAVEPADQSQQETALSIVTVIDLATGKSTPLASLKSPAARPTVVQLQDARVLSLGQPQCSISGGGGAGPASPPDAEILGPP